MNKLDKLAPGEGISATVRILEEPVSTRVGEKRLVNVKVGDGGSIVNLAAWEGDADRLDLKKNGLIEILHGKCPGSHKKGNQPPTITVTSKTEIRKRDIKFPSIDECMRKKFLDQISEYEYGILEGFIVQVYRITSYFCVKCSKFSEKMCDCGNFPEPAFRISGVFSDGTKTMAFTTTSEKVSEDLTYVRKSDAKKVSPVELMNRSHKILGYVRNGKLYVEDVLR